MTRVLIVVGACVAMSCSSQRSTTAARATPRMELTVDQLRARAPRLREHCAAMENDRNACAADGACVPSVRLSCDGHECTEGGAIGCMACIDWVALAGRVPAEYCVHRVAGRNRTACRMLFPDEPQRCERAVDAPAQPGS